MFLRISCLVIYTHWPVAWSIKDNERIQSASMYVSSAYPSTNISTYVPGATSPCTPPLL